MAELKKAVQEIAAIAGSLPDNLQAVCFEVLLKHHLGLTGPDAAGVPPGAHAGKNHGKQGESEAQAPSIQSQEDIPEAQIHAKARHFLQQNGLSIDHVNNLFYMEDGDIRPLFEDLRTTVMSDGQIRIALLQALTNALSTGKFDADVEAVRAEAKDRKVYDGANFAANFRNNADLFDFGEWSKSVKTVRLSPPGRTRLAEVVKELQ